MNFEINYKGKFTYLGELKEELKKNKIDLQKISIILNKNLFNFGLIIQSENFSFAATDRINSYPIFYNTNKNNPNFLIKDSMKTSCFVDKDHLNEFMSAGYNCSHRTIFKRINKLQSGELFFYNKNRKYLKKKFYFLFIPNYKTKQKSVKETKLIFDRVFDRMSYQIKDKPVCLFLSAGLDSRLLACKLHETGKKDITFISYGINNNYESNEARKVAKVLGVTWRHINPSARTCRRLFNSNIIKEYWESGDNYSSFLSLREFFVLKEIKDKNIISADSIIMNGQTGDFLTGGHTETLNKNLGGLNSKKLFDIIISKHFTINNDYLNKKVKNLIFKDIQTWENKIKLIDKPNDYVKFYEFWEWIERQTKYVVQSVRAYEFFKYKWIMPLWDFELIDFWKDIPLNQRIKQKLYIEYLKNYNYKNLFKDYKRTQSQFPIQYKWFIILGNIIHLLFGKSHKKKFYNIVQYFGQYNHQFKVYTLGEFIKNHDKVKNPLSLFLKTWKERRLD